MACATLKRSLEWEPVLGGRPAKRRRCTHFCATPQHSRHGPSASTSYRNTPNATVSKPKSVFPEITTNKFTPEFMAASIKAEFKRLHRLKQLKASCNTSDTSDGGSSGGEQADSTPRAVEKPLFTFKQVGMICERMVRERESEIREEYDSVLTAKLAEQYDAFVRFTYDQIQKNYQAAPSYLS